MVSGPMVPVGLSVSLSGARGASVPSAFTFMNAEPDMVSSPAQILMPYMLLSNVPPDMLYLP